MSLRQRLIHLNQLLEAMELWAEQTADELF